MLLRWAAKRNSPHGKANWVWVSISDLAIGLVVVLVVATGILLSNRLPSGDGCAKAAGWMMSTGKYASVSHLLPASVVQQSGNPIWDISQSLSFDATTGLGGLDPSSYQGIQKVCFELGTLFFSGTNSSPINLKDNEGRDIIIDSIELIGQSSQDWKDIDTSFQHYINDFPPDIQFGAMSFKHPVHGGTLSITDHMFPTNPADPDVQLKRRYALNQRLSERRAQHARVACTQANGHAAWDQKLHSYGIGEKSLSLGGQNFGPAAPRVFLFLRLRVDGKLCTGVEGAFLDRPQNSTPSPNTAGLEYKPATPASETPAPLGTAMRQ